MHHLDQLGGEGNIQLYVPPVSKILFNLFIYFLACSTT